MNRLSTLIPAIAVALSAASYALAQQGDNVSSSSPSSGQASSTMNDGAMSEGVVRKIDKDAKKITIRHGELKQLGMPPMTMVFQVKDPALLDKVQQGDKINFVAEKIGGQFAVTYIETKQ